MKATTPIPSESQERALTSASSLYRRIACPGSENAERGLPNLDGPFAAEGRLMHEHDANPAKPRDSLTESQRRTLERNAYLRETFFSAQRERLGISPDEECQTLLEQEYFLCDMDSIPISPAFPGHPDHVLYFPRLMIALLTDSKFGRIPVEAAENNYQLRCYALMFSDAYPVVKMVAGITQPWMSAPDDFHSVEFAAEDLPVIKSEILSVLAACKSPEAKRTPSLSGCMYCKAQGVCPESVDILPELAVMRMNLLTADQMEAMYPTVKRAEKVIEKYKERLHLLAERNLLKTLQLGAAGVNRDIGDPSKAFDRLFEAGNVLNTDMRQAANEFMAICSASRSQLAELVAKNREIKVEEAEARIAAALGDLLIETPRKASIVKKNEDR